MKLEHDVVQDLYPLYIENDLSPSVKTSVDEHLKECEECKSFYETGEKSFQINKIEEPAAPQSLDEKIILRMKLTRLRLISVVLAAIIFSMILTDYVNEREKMFMAVSDYYVAIENSPQMFDSIKNKEQSDLMHIEQTFYQLSEGIMEIEEYMNFIESKFYDSTTFLLSLNTQRLNSMIQVMKTRYNQGRWSETDEAAFQALKEYFKKQEEITSVEYGKTHHGYSSYLHILDVKKMDKFYENVNLLSYSYTRFHKMPEQIKVLRESELKSRIASALEINKDDIDLKKESPLNAMYVYRFDIGENGNGGEIDAVTGQITNYHGDTGPLSDGPIMDQKEAEKKAMLYLEKIYGKVLNLELVSLGFNFNSFADDSRYKVYSFKAVPKVEGYTLYTPLETETLLNLNARNGKLESFDHNRHVPSFDDLDAVDLTASSGNIDDKKAVIIYSALTGQFELVFIKPDLEYFQKDKFTSAKTRLEEKIYIDSF
ncbi:zf-HC2 domain-containing protein [Bacillus sp. ISL-55]|uniref:zf-HC2 domain-containing protein n=1 Tax=Bacillus sp. ISL-55 TaxID=2819134 RepID=UPI001BECBF1E|nr:zf-HC2 domain-containing protein [Bacillus sp. ISL-55]MBT2691597.1 zf-HC2 domain-containing protein [Bacillus sp. ISL-55]